jgi:hypothetical protein
MPSPFPGMDPYLEDPGLWPDVHAELIVDMRKHLTPKLRPRYVARVEQRTFVFSPDDPAEELYLIPDARIVESNQRSPNPAAPAAGGGTAVAVAVPINVTGLMARVAVQRYLEIRDSADHRVITVIELLSPSNKIEGSAGRRALIRKRDRVAASDASWMEIDLLREGARTVSLAEVPGSAYQAYADRTTANDREQLVWPILLRERLPRLPVPLRPGEPDVVLDLQEVLDTAYDQAAYDLGFNYSAPPNPPLTGDDAKWADALLREKQRRA